MASCASCISGSSLSASSRSLALAPNLNLSSPPSHFQQLSFHHDKGIRVRSSPLRMNVDRCREPDVVTANTWDKLVSDSDIPVLVEFHASWCESCEMIHQVIDELATEYAGRLKCFILHVDNNLQVSSYYHIKTMPAILLFKNGRSFETLVGTMPKESYEAAIERVLTP